MRHPFGARTARSARPSGDCAAPHGRLAWVACDHEWIELETPLQIPSNAPLSASTERTLKAVAALLERHPDILLMRIEVVAPPAQRGSAAAALQETQARADRVFQHLWRQEGVWAERMEAVGYGHTAPPGDRGPGTPVRLRIIQWARTTLEP